MPRLPASHRSRSPRAVRWLEVLAALQWTYERGRELWSALDQREREDLRRLLAKFRGRLADLTPEEQRRVRELVVKAVRDRRR